VRAAYHHKAVLGAVVGLLLAFFLASSLAAGQAPQQGAPNNPEPPPAPVQPIPFNHKAHMAAGLTCDSCHTNANNAVLMTFPTAAGCMKCHATLAANTSPIQKLKQYYDSKKPIPWLRVYKVLPGTGFSHHTHLTAGMQCITCHGQVSDMTAMREVKSTTSMGGCIDCHRLHKAPTTCVTCHKAWGPGMVVAK